MGKSRYKTFFVPLHLEQTYQEFCELAREQHGSAGAAIRHFIKCYVEQRRKAQGTRRLEQFTEGE